jgi:NADH:ubiquinone oxidoreductase subunit 2 (subunit N)
MLSFFSNINVDFYYGISPEFFLLTFVLFLIIIAVSTEHKEKFSLLSLCLEASLGFYIFLIAQLVFLYQSGLYVEHLTVFFCYNTLKINKILILIKICLALFAFGSLMTVQRYLMLASLTNYEYPLFISLATLAMFVSISANNWIILFLALELQALCFLVLFAWNRRSEKAINATLKFAVINFLASTLILIAIIEIILYTQTFNIYLSNPYFLLQNTYDTLYTSINPVVPNYFSDWVATKTTYSPYFQAVTKYVYTFWTQQPLFDSVVVKILEAHLYQNPALFLQSQMSTGILYNSLWQFVGFLLVLGFAMKLGLVPFGFWLADLYTSAALPVLTFFSTAPKLTYVTILLSLYINLFLFVNPTAFLYPFIFLGVTTMLVANVAMFTVRNNLLVLLAWSSIANMGLFFLLFGKYPLGAYTLSFLLYYLISTFVFFLLLQYFLMMDETGVVRHPIYFADLSVVRFHSMYKLIFILLVFSFLNFFGIPPLLGFWMKFSALQALVLSTVTFYDWFIILILLFVTLIGGFSYIRVLYTLVTENQQLGLQLLYWPDTKDEILICAAWFILAQIFGFFAYTSLPNYLHINFLLTQSIFYGDQSVLMMPFWIK